MNSLIVIGTAHCFYLAFLVLTKTPRSMSEYLLASFFVAVGGLFWLVYASLIYDESTWLLPIWNVSMLLAPLFFLYVLSLIDSQNGWRPVYLWHFALYATSTFYMLYLLGALPETEIIRLFDDSPFFARPALYQLFYIIEELILPVYLVWIFMLLKQHQRRIVQSFSYREDIDLTWIRYLVVGLAVATIVTQIAYLLADRGQILDRSTSLQYGFSVATFCIFYMGYFGFRQNAIFQPAESTHVAPVNGNVLARSATTQRTKYEKSGLSNTDADAYSEQLLVYMKRERPYLDGRFSLQDLSGPLQLPTHHLSQIINERFGESFFDFSNRYRVEAFKTAVVNTHDQRKTLLSIAYDCGFNSKASFNRVFKKFTGMTPSEYAKRNHELQTSRSRHRS